MEIVLILILILFNGLLSMAEIAIVSLKRTRLQQLKDQGDSRAETVLNLLDDPNKLFSTIQVGITLIGVFTGALGGIALSEPIREILSNIGFDNRLSESIAIFIVVIIITYLSIVIGELVPKRIGLLFSEKITLWMAVPLNFLSRIFSPFVRILSNSTDGVLRILNIRHKNQTSVSGDEVKLMLREGAQMGIFESTEKNIVEKALNLSEIKVNSLMTSRNKIIWLDKNASADEIKEIVLNNQFTYFPICNKELDDVIGIVSADDLLATFVVDKKPDLKKLMHKPVLIPESKKVLHILELFKRTRIHMGLVLDEYGNIEGLITITDILEAIVGDLPDINEKEDRKITKRNANSWLVDGLLSINDFKEHFDIESIPNDDAMNFHTIGGFVMDRLGKVPITGDHFELNGYKIEVVDMDGNRVDKVMITRQRD